MAEYVDDNLYSVETPKGTDVCHDLLAHGAALAMFEAAGPGEWSEEEYVQYSTTKPADYEEFLIVACVRRAWYYAEWKDQSRICASLEEAASCVGCSDELVVVDGFTARVRRFAHENGFAEHHVVDLVPGVPPHSVIHVAAHYPVGHVITGDARDDPVDFPLFDLLCCLDEWTTPPTARFADYFAACVPFWGPPLWIKHRFHFNFYTSHTFDYRPYVDTFVNECYRDQEWEETSILLYKTFTFHSLLLLQRNFAQDDMSGCDAVFKMTPEIQEKVATLWRKTRDDRGIVIWDTDDWWP